MWLVRPALELGMKLHTDIKLPVGELKSFNKFSVRSESAKYRTMTLESFPVIVVELPAMTVSFAYFLFSIALSISVPGVTAQGYAPNLMVPPLTTCF